MVVWVWVLVSGQARIAEHCSYEFWPAESLQAYSAMIAIRSISMRQTFYQLNSYIAMIVDAY